MNLENVSLKPCLMISQSCFLLNNRLRWGPPLTPLAPSCSLLLPLAPSGLSPLSDEAQIVYDITDTVYPASTSPPASGALGVSTVGHS